MEVVAAGAAILLLIGLWTPIAGGLVAVAQLGLALSHPADPWTHVQFGVLGAALAMLGPGGCSVDARLFGRKQIQIPQALVNPHQSMSHSPRKGCGFALPSRCLVEAPSRVVDNVPFALRLQRKGNQNDSCTWCFISARERG